MVGKVFAFFVEPRAEIVTKQTKAHASGRTPDFAHDARVALLRAGLASVGLFVRRPCPEVLSRADTTAVPLRSHVTSN